MKPKGELKFTHHSGREVTFNYEKNDLNGNMMWWFSTTNSMYAGTMADVNRIISNIKEKCKINES